MLKKLLKSITPPAIISLYHWLTHPKNKNGSAGQAMWGKGNYTSWENALKDTTGYNNAIILDKVTTAALKVKNGEAVFERDSVLFNKKQYSWPVLSYLQHIAIENNNYLNIIDFGGSLGSSYYQYKNFFAGLKVNWFIVEQASFYKVGKSSFETNELKFAKNITEALSLQPVKAILISAVLQYMPNPFEFLSELISFRFSYIIFDRTAFIEDQPDRITIQTVPPEIYDASYPCWFFNERSFLNKFNNLYTIEAEFSSYAEPEMVYTKNAEKLYWKGFVLKLIS